MEPEIMHADRRQRRLVATAIVLGLALALASVFWFRHALEAHAETVTTQRFMDDLRLWLGILAAVAGICFALLAAHAARTAAAIRKEQRWPLAAARPLRDTPVLRGAQALARTRWLSLAAILALLGALGAGLVGARLILLAG